MSAWTWAWYNGKEVEVESPELEKALRKIKELEDEIERLRRDLALERER